MLSNQLQGSEFQHLLERLHRDAEEHELFPPPDEIYRALECTPLPAVRAVIVGQDPYHGPGQAHGLCFSVPHGVSIPPSLKNIFRELRSDLGVEPPEHGCLEAWARQGVLLLNSVLTVRANQANSHRGWGWEALTDTALTAVSHHTAFCVFLLWGNDAQKKQRLIASRHAVICAPHPSPLSAHRGFLGSRVFSRCNQALASAGIPPIDWRLDSN